MPTTFYALDQEFAVATGSNVNDDTGRSTFDYPPNSTKDLVVSANDGDTRPGAFEIGETYDVTFGGNGGVSLEDAVVIRSDYLGDNKGVIVFEGTDAGGDLTQVVWTPNFDLEGWYWDNFSDGSPPGFWTSDQQPGYFEFVCFAPGTMIRTPLGERRVETLRPGDLVDTLDHGAQPLLWSGSRTLRFPPWPDTQRPVLIRAGALGDSRPFRDLIVSPQHRFLVTGEKVAEIVGHEQALAKAKSLIPLPGVRVMRGRQEVTYISLLFSRHQLLFADNALVESFYPGPWALSLLDSRQRAQIIALMPRVRDDVAAAMGPLVRPQLPHRRALRLAQQNGLHFVAEDSFAA